MANSALTLSRGLGTTRFAVRKSYLQFRLARCQIQLCDISSTREWSRHFMGRYGRHVDTPYIENIDATAAIPPHPEKYLKSSLTFPLAVRNAATQITPRVLRQNIAVPPALLKQCACFHQHIDVDNRPQNGGHHTNVNRRRIASNTAPVIGIMKRSP